MSICSLLSATALIMRDGEEKVLTTDNMFYNTLSARQALRRHHVEAVAIDAVAHADVPAATSTTSTSRRC
jgi:hypothetical protein